MADQITINRAVVSLGGKQHLVSAGTRFEVNRITQAEGETIETKDILTGMPVILKVVTHPLGPKIRGLKFKNKVRYIRHYGHRQQLSTIEVVSLGSAKTEKPKSAPKTPSTVKKVVKAKPAAKKTAKND